MERTQKSSELRGMVETLMVLLRGQLREGQRIARLLKKRVRAEARGALPEREECLEREKEALEAYIFAERERIAALSEIGHLLGVSNPSRLRIAELVFYVPPDLRDELLDVREDLRDLADELGGLRAWGSRFEHHYLGRVTLFLAHGLANAKNRRWLLERLGAAGAQRSRRLPEGGHVGSARTDEG